MPARRDVVLVHADQVESGQHFAFDVCIVGAGAAGITLARRLKRAGVSIALLESGGFEPDPPTQDLSAGTERGNRLGIEGSYLMGSRVRVFGGSTHHWMGWCRPLDAIDFEARPWMAGSGWPITEADLTVHYADAAKILELRPFDDEGDARREGILPFDEERMVTRFFHFSPPTRFGVAYRDELVEDPNVRLFLGANVVDVKLAGDAAVSHVEVATLNRRRFSVSARWFVLAAGGIENARLLLASDSQRPGGLGNQRDLVGRYFMEHPHLDAVARLALAHPSRNYRVYNVFDSRRERAEGALLFLSPAMRRAEKLQGIGIQLIDGWIPESRPRKKPDVRPTGRRVKDRDYAKAIYRLGRLAAEHVRQPDGQPVLARLDVRCEQSPNRESRVTLSNERDALGVRRVALDWRLRDGEAESLLRALHVTAIELGRQSQGRLRVILDESAPWREVYGASHHMGTTRMASHEEHGVVDANGRVFGLANLFVAGSSLFPTVGVANPTFTIVALTLRLGDHLAGVVGRG